VGLFYTDRIRAYGAEHPTEYGGLFDEAGRTVVLFTGHLEAHGVTLHELLEQELLEHPELIDIRRADRTWTEVEVVSQRIQRTLMIPGRHPAVFSVGLTVKDGQFAVMILIDPSRRELTDEIVELAQADPMAVVIHYGGPARAYALHR
jgi:hypothetical protein